MDFDDFVARIGNVKYTNGGGVSASCPSHDDAHNSLVVNRGDNGGIVAYCHAGCDIRQIVDAMGLAMHDLAGAPHVVAEYPYTDAQGTLLWTVQRWQPKDFRCDPGLPLPAARVLYNLPLLLAGIARHRRVFIVEGEKDVERLAEVGEIATCNVGGAGPGKWLPHYNEWLRDADVTIIADRDMAGVVHARAIAEDLRPVAAHVSLAMPRYGKDVSELLDAGYTLEALDPLPLTDALGLVQGSDVRPKPVRWLWDGYLPAGKVVLIEGDPGDGKSILTIDLAARFSSGAAMPDGTPTDGPMRVLMITAEDDPEDTIAPRLLAAGANMTNVYLCTHGVDESRPFDVRRDIAELYREVRQHQVRIIMLDPLMAMLGDEVDSHNDSSVRRALYPLYAIARDLVVTVLVVRHLNKGVGKAIYRGGGSIAFAGAARAVFNVGRDPDECEKRIFSCVKANMARRPASLVYTIEPGVTGPRVVWHGSIDVDAQSVVDGISDEVRAESRDAVEFLNGIVDDEPMPWREIVKCGREDGHSERTLRRARARSRLVKIVGAEGNRSTRWGYAAHAAETHAASSAGGPPGHWALSGSQRVGATDWPKGSSTVTDSSDPVPDAPTSIDVTEGDESGVAGSHMASVTAPSLGQKTWTDGPVGQMGLTYGNETVLDPTEVAQRDADLAGLPLTCGHCGTDAYVDRYGRPYWVVRCVDHSPLIFDEKGLDQ